MQLPILIGAVFLVNYPKGFLSMGDQMELEVSIVTLVLLIAIAIYGSGRLSIDHMRRKEREERERREEAEEKEYHAEESETEEAKESEDPGFSQ